MKAYLFLLVFFLAALLLIAWAMTADLAGADDLGDVPGEAADTTPRDSTPPMKEGESPDLSGPRGSPATPPRAPDAGGPGRVSTPAAWGFIAWGPAGERMGGRLRDTRDECESLLAEHRAQHPDWVFSACVWVRAERGTL